MARTMRFCFILPVLAVLLGAALVPVPAAADDPPGVVAATASETVPERVTLLGLLRKGGVVMVPIAICSLIAAAVAIERSLSLRRRRVIPPAFVEAMAGLSGGAEAAARDGIARCEADASPVSRIFRAGFERLRKGEAAVAGAVMEAGAREVGKLKRSLRPLSAIATLAPLFGLLGTVYGMIVAFEAAATAGVDRADTLARGIYEALVTTAAGLTLAIPTLIVFQVLNTRVDVLVDEIDERATEVFDGLFDAAPAAGEEGA